MKQITFYLIVVLALSACAEVETLVDDRFEENDSQEDAKLISEGSKYRLLTISEADDDWYEMESLSADSISIICDFIHVEGDINLDIVDWKGDIRTSAISETDNEVFSYIVDLKEAGQYNIKTHYIHVYTSSPWLQEYSLWWEDINSRKPKL